MCTTPTLAIELLDEAVEDMLSENRYAGKSVTFDPALGGLKIDPKTRKLDLGTVRLGTTEPGVRLRAEKNDSAKGKAAEPPP